MDERRGMNDKLSRPATRREIGLVQLSGSTAEVPRLAADKRKQISRSMHDEG